MNKKNSHNHLNLNSIFNNEDEKKICIIEKYMEMY